MPVISLQDVLDMTASSPPAKATPKAKRKPQQEADSGGDPRQVPAKKRGRPPKAEGNTSGSPSGSKRAKKAPKQPKEQRQDCLGKKAVYRPTCSQQVRERIDRMQPGGQRPQLSAGACVGRELIALAQARGTACS